MRHGASGEPRALPPGTLDEAEAAARDIMQAIEQVPARPRIDEGVAVLQKALDQAISCRSFRRVHWRAVADFFGGVHCVFCGAAEIDDRLQWLHLVPVESGGDTVAGNVVIACWHCGMGWPGNGDEGPELQSLEELELYRLAPRSDGADDAPWDVPSCLAVIAWSDDDRSGVTECWGCGDPTLMRWRVATYVATFAYTPRSRDARLTAEERTTLEDLRRRIDALAADASRFIASYRNRSGSE